MKAYFKQKGFRVWFIVTACLVSFMIAAGIVLSAYSQFVNIILGGEIAVYAEGREPRYTRETDSKEEALEEANELNERICEEGMVLLRNENGALPLEKGAKVSVFGKNSVNLVYGGSGSGGGDNKNAVKLCDALRAAGFEVNPTLEAFYSDNNRSGPRRSGNPSDLDSGADVSLETAETPYSSYTSDITGSYGSYRDAALIVLSRIGGEGFDLPRTSADDASRHYLELDPNEIALVRAVTSANFGRVIVLVNSANVMELGWAESGAYGKIDAVLCIGAPGNSGISSLGRILNGEISPSGRTVDTWASDLLAAPSVRNFGSNGVKDGDAYFLDGKRKSYYTVSYEEGIYVGYRYYETRAAAYNGAVPSLGEKEYADGAQWYRDNVVYPFGYGLSYTTFTRTITSKPDAFKLDENGRCTLEVGVTVENTGKVPGKETVEFYVTAPYTKGGIEKAYVVLGGFAKTSLLKPGTEETVTVTLEAEELASYDFDDRNGNGFKGYELEAGDYVFRLMENAHEELESFTLTLQDGFCYKTDPVTGGAVVNRYDDAAEGLGSVLSRSDFAGTFPVPPTQEEREKDKAFFDALDSRKTNNPNDYRELPKTGQAGEADLYDLISSEDYEGYGDARWEALLDTLSADEMANLFNFGAFHTEPILKIGKPKTTDADGPAGFTNFLGDDTIYATCAYASEVVLACSWNTGLAHAMGKSVGEEGLWGNRAGDGAPYSGWYAPGVNLHRNAFGGRNFEYFSEDSLLTGMMAASEITGAAEKGVYCYMKHFAVNEQETHRSGVATWLTEQSLRELYLRPFELAVKKGHAHAVMSSFNRIGTVWTGGDYRLLTEILRNEWGFEGTVICDFNTNGYMNVKQMAYAGGDLNLATDRFWDGYDPASPGDVTVLRNAAKHILYTVSTSNALNAEVIGYRPPVWVWCMSAAAAAVTVGLAVWGFFAVTRAKRAVSAGRKSAADPEE